MPGHLEIVLAVHRHIDIDHRHIAMVADRMVADRKVVDSLAPLHLVDHNSVVVVQVAPLNLVVEVVVDHNSVVVDNSVAVLLGLPRYAVLVFSVFHQVLRIGFPHLVDSTIEDRGQDLYRQLHMVEAHVLRVCVAMDFLDQGVV